MNLPKLINYVKQKHDGQLRKYTGEPYFMHLLNVASMADDNCQNGFEIGLCHDLFEDTDCTPEELYRMLKIFGYKTMQSTDIVHAVDDLTDKFTSEAYPDMNRGLRKIKEAKGFGLFLPMLKR